MNKVQVLGVPIVADPSAAVIDTIAAWAAARESRFVCLSNTHMLVEAQHEPSFLHVLQRADLNCADGLPVAVVAKLLGADGATQIRGADLTRALLAVAATAGLRVGFFGGKPDVLDRLVTQVRTDYPGLEISYAYSPPFRRLEAGETDAIVRELAASRTSLLFVGLGCPKQERWMDEHRGRVPAVMLGVGAAFDMLAGEVGEAPRWVRRAGLEWLHRLRQEPRRLFARYARNNPAFVALALKQLWAHWRARRP